MQATQAPSEIVIEPKGKVPAQLRSTKDWDAEEKNEKDSKPTRGVAGQILNTPEDIIAESNFRFVNWNDTRWLDPTNGVQYMVSNYYPNTKIVIDYPPTAKYVESKRNFFKSIKQLALVIPQGESLDVETAKAELDRQRAAFERDTHAPATETPHATADQKGQQPVQSKRTAVEKAPAKHKKGKRHVR